jgi:hypothetical protein
MEILGDKTCMNPDRYEDEICSDILFLNCAPHSVVELVGIGRGKYQSFLVTVIKGRGY